MVLAIVVIGDQLLELIAGDQISDEAILGCQVPERARPILRAVDGRQEPVLRRPGGPVLLGPVDAPGPLGAPVDEAFASAVSWLLKADSADIPVGDLTPVLRARLEVLRAKGILELEHGAYRASEIAWYSSYQLPPPAAHPGTDKHPGRITCVHPDFG